MDKVAHRSDFVRPVVLAVLMTLLAEAFYFFVWGVVMFPQGSLVGKFWWTLTCGIAMGSVIGAATVVFVVGKLHGPSALLSVAFIFFAVGVACALLCSALDARFNYFGGEEHALLFVIGGGVPALIGGFLYGWLLFSEHGRKHLHNLGL
jgi:ubiquinol-cytochrome c reductase iron-sulfur subunit